MPAIDWRAFEDAVAKAALPVIRQIMNQSTETFYAVAFDEFYAETCELMKMPWLATNSLEALTSAGEASRWSSADWNWKLLPYADKNTRKLHRAIDKHAANGDEEHWNAVYSRFVEAFIHVAQALYAQLKDHPRADQDFGVFVFTEDDEIQVLQKCTTPAQLQKLFPHVYDELQRRNDTDASSLPVKLEIYRQALRAHKSEIIELGPAAIPMLLDALRDKEQAWCAADWLGELGVADPQVIAALRARARKGNVLAFHETAALAVLGDVNFLLKLADNPKTQDIAIQGIRALYCASVYESCREIALDYRPMEQLLKKPECKRKVKKLFSGSLEINQFDIDEALRGLNSEHAAIREHAVCVLGARQLGRKAAERILPALAASLRDRNATVRRLAILALSRWKKTAKPFAKEIRKLFKDPSASVAFTAKHYVTELR